jgi:hypothetical protein
MWIYFRVSMEWTKIGTNWNLENCGFFIYTGSTISWSWNYSIITATSFIIETTGSTNIIGSIWMLSVT